MERTIIVSTEVFSAIWSRRHDGEETEDQILRRVLGCKPSTETASLPHGLDIARSSAGLAGSGVRDHRNGIHFREGFEIFRAYKGRVYEAVATNGCWQRRDNWCLYPTLNQLNSSIVSGAENVWNGNWKFRDQDGEVKSIGSLRHRAQANGG